MSQLNEIVKCMAIQKVFIVQPFNIDMLSKSLDAKQVLKNISKWHNK